MTEEKRITREIVISEFQALPPGTEISTFRLARRLGCDEYQVRAAVSWLVMGGQLREAGTIKRSDVQGRRYSVKYYVFTGRSDIERVPRDPRDRRMMLDRRGESTAVDQFLRAPVRA